MKRLNFTQNNLSVINFEATKLPSFEEKKGKGFIKCGETNEFFDYLIKLFNRSAKHNAIITGKVNYIVGGGIQVDSDNLQLKEELELKAWTDKIDFNSLLPKVTTDLELFGGFYLEIIPSRIGGIAEVNHIEYQKIRISLTKDYFLYSNDWSKYRQSAQETGLKRIDIYNNNTKSGLIYYKQYRPGDNVYATPEYIGAVPYIEMDTEVANFHLNNIKNGFSGGTMLSFNSGLPTAEEQKVIEAKVKDKFTGTDNAGQLLITFANDKDRAPSVIPLLPNNLDAMFIQLNETITQEIFTGHKITSLSLFGIKESKGLGSKDELLDAFQLFQNGYINSKQSIIENVFNNICEYAGKPRAISILKTQPLTASVPEQKLYEVMTVDEIREKAGLPILQKEPTQLKEHFHAHYNVEKFLSIGRPKSNFRILQKQEVSDSKDVLIKEISFYKQGFAGESKLELSILDLIEKDGRISIENIAKALKKDTEEVKTAYDKLIEKQLLKASIGEPTVLTPQGLEVVSETTAPTNGIQVLYGYEERDNLPPLLTESREFCQELMKLDKLYTRQEIESISASEDRDVWATRGGWFHNTKFDQTTPYCRHIWKQFVVKLK